MKMKMKNRSYRYDINKSKSRHGYKYGKYKKCLSMMMLICIPGGIYLRKVNNRNTRTRCETCSKLTIKIPE